MNERIQAQVKPTQKSSFAPSSTRLLQRKCACGETAGLSGVCEECSKKKRFGLQTKLKVNRPGDIYEREADRVADQVMATPRGLAVRDAPPRIQRFSEQSNGQMDAAPASVDEALASPGRPLKPALRQDMEQRFGHDFSQVRVHADARAVESARALNAMAYTVGRDVVFGGGQYAPFTAAGKMLLAHELAHVIQQRDAPTNLQKLSLSTEVTGEHEREADMAAEVVGLGHSARVMGRVNSSRVQRKPRGAKIDLGKAAGGCGLCYGKLNIKDAGSDAHKQIKQDFEVEYPNLLPDLPIELPQATHIISKGVPDLILPTRTGFMIGEIKPANPEGYIEGEAKLVIYDELLNLRYKKINPNLTVERMDQKPPPPSTFVEPAAGVCKQAIIVNPSVRGVYGYLCYPPWSYQLSKRCCRGRGKEKEDKKKKDKKKKAPAGSRRPLAARANILLQIAETHVEIYGAFAEWAYSNVYWGTRGLELNQTFDKLIKVTQPLADWADSAVEFLEAIETASFYEGELTTARMRAELFSMLKELRYSIVDAEAELQRAVNRFSAIQESVRLSGLKYESAKLALANAYEIIQRNDDSEESLSLATDWEVEAATWLMNEIEQVVRSYEVIVKKDQINWLKIRR